MKQTIGEYLASLKRKRVAVLGLGVSNMPLIRMLLGAGVEVTACDRSSREKLGEAASELEALGAVLCLGESYLDCLPGHEVIFRTPGLRPDLPQILSAVEQGGMLTSEMEVFFQVCPCPILAVTGSDGKTTTSTVTAKFLEAAGYTVHLGGNIGRPLLSEVAKMKPEDLAVLELSSFQLLTMGASPHVGAITNLAPNHLDVHLSMEEYVSAKENIFLHQKPGDCVVLNFDNALTRGLGEKASAEVRWFSRREEVKNGVFHRDGVIWASSPEAGSRPVLSAGEIRIPGIHNVENYMTAIALVQGWVSDEIIRTVAASFCGVEHRIELVRERGGVRYYNDSIASSPSRTIAGLRSFEQKVILIAGGYDKHIPYDPLGAEIVEHTKAVVLTGDTAEKIKGAIEGADMYEPGKPEIAMVPDFREAVLTAHRLAKPGDVVLLSPASASFDRFQNFAQRGECFRQIIQEIEE